MLTMARQPIADSSAASASDRTTIRAGAITPRSCRSSAKAPQRGQFVPDRIFAEHTDLIGDFVGIRLSIAPQ
jgi:hypothetical protein